MGVAGHVDLDAQAAVYAPTKGKTASNASADLDLIAALVRADGEVLVHRITVVDNTKFDLIGIAGGHANRAVVGIHMDASPAADAVRLGPFFGAGRSCCERACQNSENRQTCQPGYRSSGCPVREGKSSHFCLCLCFGVRSGPISACYQRYENHLQKVPQTATCFDLRSWSCQRPAWGGATAGTGLAPG